MKNLSRRRFFEDSVMAAAAAALPAPLMAVERGKAVSPNEKLTVAILGCGIRGKAHARELARLPDCDIAWVCDPDLDRAVRQPVGQIGLELGEGQLAIVLDLAQAEARIAIRQDRALIGRQR